MKKVAMKWVAIMILSCLVLGCEQEQPAAFDGASVNKIQGVEGSGTVVEGDGVHEKSSDPYSHEHDDY